MEGTVTLLHPNPFTALLLGALLYSHWLFILSLHTGEFPVSRDLTMREIPSELVP